MYRLQDIRLPPTYMPKHPFFGAEGIDKFKDGRSSTSVARLAM